MKNAVVMSWNNDSAGAKALAAGLHIRRLKHLNSAFVPSPQKAVINWGCGEFIPLPGIEQCQVVNHPDKVAICANKKKFFQYVDHDERVVPWTTDDQVVLEWFQNGHTACARKKLEGSGGDGLVIFDGTNEFVRAPLYTMYIKKKHEFRVHIGGHKIFLVQQKKRSKEAKDNPLPEHMGRRGMVRSHANGYIFARNDIEPPACVIEVAAEVMENIGLDFGAVDVIYNEYKDRAWVCEVNTAPGIEGSTVDDYVKMIKELIA